MTKVKYILIGVLALIVILLIAAAFLPKGYHFQLQHKVESKSEVVFNLLGNLDNRVQWDSLTLNGDVVLDKINNRTLFKWDSATKGSGRIESKVDLNTNSIILKKYLKYSNIPEVTNYTVIDIDIKETELDISFKGRQTWPFNLFNIIKKRKQAKILKSELDALEYVAKQRDKTNVYNGFKVIEEVIKEKSFITKRDKVVLAAVQQFYVQNLGVLFKDAQSVGLEMDGMPSVLFYSKIKNADVLDMAAAIPVTEEVNIANADSEYIKPRKAVVVDYYGDYNNSIFAHNAIEAYFDDNGYLADVPVIEEYITDPTSEKDPSKWLTKITYYIIGQ